ncbi:hypothetical protein CR513_01923, partial [Mucuna pruriens]
MELRTPTFTFRLSKTSENDAISCKLFPGTLRGALYNGLQFTNNRTKRLEVVDLFDIRQAKGESLKKDMAWFNNAMV